MEPFGGIFDPSEGFDFAKLPVNDANRITAVGRAQNLNPNNRLKTSGAAGGGKHCIGNAAVVGRDR